MIDFPTWFNYGCYGGLVCCTLAITVNALYTMLRKWGTMRQLVGAIAFSVASALLLFPAILWYNLHFSSGRVALSTLEVGLASFYVALFGWISPFGVTIVYCLLTQPRTSNTVDSSQGQQKGAVSVKAEEVSADPPRHQPVVPAPFVYSADRPWGWLVYRNGKFIGQELALKRSIASIGREEDNEVWLDDDTISRYHAALMWDKGQVYVTDNDSLNGVLLNKQRIHTSMPVNPGDELEIGIHRFVLKYAKQSEAADDLDDPLLPQLRRISASRNSAGSSVLDNAPQVKRPLGPTIALSYSQTGSEQPFEDVISFAEDLEDISRQDTVELTKSTPIPLPKEPMTPIQIPPSPIPPNLSLPLRLPTKSDE